MGDEAARRLGEARPGGSALEEGVLCSASCMCQRKQNWEVAGAALHENCCLSLLIFFFFFPHNCTSLSSFSMHWLQVGESYQ